MTKGLDEISKKGFSRDFRAAANNQKLGKMWRRVFSTKTYKENWLHFLLIYYFAILGGFQDKRRREKHGIE